MKYFIAGSTARTAADLAGIHRNSAIRFFHKLREKIAIKQQNRSEQFAGKIEIDESYFGGYRKGKRGRGAAGKVPVFGLLKRGGKVYTQIVDDTKTETLLPIIRSHVQPDSIVYTDCYRSYNVLDVSEFKHFRINHSKLFAQNHNHINGIEKLRKSIFIFVCVGLRFAPALESSKKAYAKVQRHPKTELQFVLERM
jgi:transposase